jgi:hypothetical protein
MSIFEPVVLTWNGAEHTVAADKVMGLIARVEDIITLPEINNILSGKSNAPFAKLASAYSAALSYAGAQVITEDVYRTFFGADAKANVPMVLHGLLMMMVPPVAIQEDYPAKESKPGKRKAPAGLSKPRTLAR